MVWILSERAIIILMKIQGAIKEIYPPRVRLGIPDGMVFCCVGLASFLRSFFRHTINHVYDLGGSYFSRILKSI